MADDPGAKGEDVPAERKGRADREHARESVVLRAVAVFDTDPPLSCGLMDISAGGCRLKLEYLAPRVDADVILAVDPIGLRVSGKVVRTYDTPTGLEVAIRFNSVQTQVPGKMLQYKLKSIGRLAGGRR